MTSPEQWLTAGFHEAGHAVGGYRHFSWPFQYVELVEGKDGAVIGHLVPVPGITKDPIAYACACLAGPLAEQQFSGCDWDDLAKDVAATDIRMALNALADLNNPPSLLSLISQTRAILKAHWRLVERVAFELADRRHLNHDQVLKLTARR